MQVPDYSFLNVFLFHMNYTADNFLIWKLFVILDDSQTMELERQVENVDEGDVFIELSRKAIS